MSQRSALAARGGLIIAITVGLAVCLTGVLSGFKFSSLLGQAVTSRMEVMTGTVTAEAELGLTLGLPLANLVDLQALVERQAADDSRVVALSIFDETGQTLFSTPKDAVGSVIPQSWRTAWQGAGTGHWIVVSGDRTVVGTILHGPDGEAVGGVALGYVNSSLHKKVRGVIKSLMPEWIILIAGSVLAALLAGIATIRLTVGGSKPLAERVRPLGLRLAGITLAVLLSASAITAWKALTAFEPVILPEVTLKAAAVGGTLTGEIERALLYDIPLNRLPGVDTVFDTTLKANPDIAYLTLSDPSGRRLAGAGVGMPDALSEAATGAAAGSSQAPPGYLVTQLPITAGTSLQGTLDVGVDRLVVAQVARDLALDIGSVLLASVLIAFELVLVVAARAANAVGTAARSRPGSSEPAQPTDLTLIRLPLFLFCLSEEISRPFFPSFSRSFADGVPWLSPDLVVSLPITVFMLVWAVSQPLGALWSERIGRRRAIIIGALFAAFGLAMTAIAATLYDLLLWRTLTALGYGMVLIAAQGAVIDQTGPRQQATGLSLVIGGLVAAGVCGPLIGGIIADQVGFRPTFLFGAGLALAAAAVVALVLPRATAPVKSGSAPSSADWPVLIRLGCNPRFLALTLFSAIPTKIAATALLFYLVPLFLGTAGASKADIGRIQMLYFLTYILISPLVAWLADRYAAGRELVAFGGFATLLAVLPLLISDSLWVSATAMVLFGLVQTLIGAPQLTLVFQVSEPRADGSRPDAVPTLGVFRLIERIGAAVGPLIAVILAITLSYREAIIAIGLLCSLSALLFLIAFPKAALPPPSLRPTETMP